MTISIEVQKDLNNITLTNIIKINLDHWFISVYIFDITYVQNEFAYKSLLISIAIKIQFQENTKADLQNVLLQVPKTVNILMFMYF